MKTRNVIIIWLLMGALFASWMQKKDLRDKVNQYETEVILATDEIRELDEQNAYLRKTILVFPSIGQKSSYCRNRIAKQVLTPPYNSQ